MKRTTILYASLALATLLATPACRLHNGDEPKTETTEGETPLSYQLDLPASIQDIDAQELEALRGLYQRNGLEADVTSDKPTEWNMRHLAVNFVKDAEGKAHVSQLLTGTAGTSPITHLDVLSRETYPELQEINLVAPRLSKVNLHHLPKLTKLALTGSAGNQSAPLTAISYDVLEALEEVSLQDFPKLKTTNEDNAFKLPVEKKLSSGEGADMLPHLKKLTLSGLSALEDLYIEPLYASLSQGVHLSALPAVDLIKVSHATLSNLELDGRQFPQLRHLTLHHVEAGSASALKLSAFAKLETFDISQAPSLSTAEITACPELQSITIEATQVSSPKLAELPKLRSLDLSDNEIARIDLSSFMTLTRLDLGHNRLAELATSALPASLQTLTLSGNEELTSLDLQALKELQHFDCYGLKKGATAQDHNQHGKLAQLNIKGLKKLETLRVPNNQLTSVFEEGQSYPELETLDLAYNSLSPASFVWTYAILGPTKRDADDYDRSVKQSKVTLSGEVFEGQAPFSVTLDQQGNFSYADVATALKAARFDPSDPSFLSVLWMRGGTEIPLNSNASTFTGDGIDTQSYTWPFDREGNSYRIRFSFSYPAMDGLLPSTGMTSLPFTIR